MYEVVTMLTRWSGLQLVQSSWLAEQAAQLGKEHVTIKDLLDSGQ